MNNYFSFSVPTGLNGLTNSTYEPYALLNYNGSTKQLLRMTSAMVIIFDNGRTRAEYNKTCTHELGHALGWFGHSSRINSYQDVMYAHESTVQKLTYYDKIQLNQVY